MSFLNICIYFCAIASFCELCKEGYNYYQWRKFKKDKEIELESEKKISNKNI